MVQTSEIKKVKNTSDLIKKSIAASLLISLGNYALLKLGNPIGPVIFAFGLLGVCYLGLNLFTGKCGFLFEKTLDPIDPDRESDCWLHVWIADVCC